MAVVTEPILASSLWDANGPSKSIQCELATKCPALDAALKGGFHHGNITCISAESEAGSKEITQALLISHLLHSSNASAFVIDTGHAVNIPGLYRSLTAGISEDDATASKATARAALDRVKIVRPFDFEGLTEGMSELRDVLEGRTAQKAAEKAPRGTVADSQDDPEEMLDMPTPPPKPVAQTASLPKQQGNGGLLIIDSFTQLAAPLLKSNHASGQALITSFMRSLRHLTKTHNLYTVILNSTVPTTGPNYKEESPSAFSSCAVRPALGKTLTYLVDVHLLIHLMPKTGKDARTVHGERRVEEPAEMASVIEVLQDRYAGRVGRWAAFTTDAEGKLIDVT